MPSHKMIAASVFFLHLWLVSVAGAPAQATTITDTFDIKLTFKEWCQDNPKFFENFNVKINRRDPSDNTTLTITRDPLNTGDTTDFQASMETHGRSADQEAIDLKGTFVLSNPAGRKAEFALSGVHPVTPTHFLTLRGQAILDKFGNVIKMTGTFMVQETNTYTLDKNTGQQSGPGECLASGTFVTGKEVGGTLTVSGAPVNAGDEFDANAYLTMKRRIRGVDTLFWFEKTPNKSHIESVSLITDPFTGEPYVLFIYADINEVPPPGTAWICGSPFVGSPCTGVTVNRNAGTVTLSQTVVDPSFFGAPGGPITLDGTLTFRAY